MSIHDETWDRPTCHICKKEIAYGEHGKHGTGKCDKKKTAKEQKFEMMAGRHPARGGCTGPSAPSDKYVAEVTQAVLKFLKDKYKVRKYMDENTDSFGRKNMLKARKKGDDLLKQAIFEILDHEECESW